MSDPYKFITSSGRKSQLEITGAPGDYHVLCHVIERETGTVHVTAHTMDCLSEAEVTRQMLDYCERNFN